jgi:cytoskeleton protein RodZ
MAEQVGRRLVYIVLTLFLVVPAWMATQQHLANNAGGTAAPLDLPVGTARQSSPLPTGPNAPRTVVASMTPVAVARVAAPEIVIRTRGESWITVTATDGHDLEKGLVPANSERRYSAAQVARMTIGNAAAVDVEHQGRNVDMGSFARANVARFTVSSDGSLVAAD